MDVKKLNTILKYTGVLGLSPYFTYKHGKYIYPKLGNAFTLLLLSAITFESFGIIELMVHQVETNDFQLKNISFPILHVLLYVCRLLLFFIWLYNNFFMKNEWKAVMEFYGYVTSSFDKLKIEDRNAWMKLTDVILVLLPLYTLTMIALTAWLNLSIYSYLKIVVNYFTNMVLFLNFVFAICFKRCYEKVGKYLLRTSKDSVIDGKSILVQLHHVGKIYRILKECLDLFNKIMGTTVLVLHGYSVVIILTHFNNFMLKKPSNPCSTLDFLVIVVFNVVTIMASDAVVIEAEKIYPLCLKLAERFPSKSQERQELFILANKCECFVPVFSAAGFFTIRRHTIFSLMSIMTTYLIIIIQFNNG